MSYAETCNTLYKLDRIEVSYRGASFGLAKLVDPHLNSQLHAGTAYEKPA